MLSLREYRNKAERLADFLPWAALIGPGVLLNKDGSFQRTARFRGPDLDSATPAELVATTARLNSVLRRLGSGWALFADLQFAAAFQHFSSTPSFDIRELLAYWAAYQVSTNSRFEIRIDGFFPNLLE